MCHLEIDQNINIHLMYPVSHEDGKIDYLLNILKQLSIHLEIKRCLYHDFKTRLISDGIYYF